MNKLAKNISIYSLGNILNKVVQFLLLPIYTRVLNPADYGKLELTYLVGGLLAILFGLLVEIGYARLYYDSKDENWRRTLYFSGQFFNLVSSLFIILLVILFSQQIAEFFFNFKEGKYYLNLICIITLLKTLTHIPLNNLRNREKPKQFIAANLLAVSVTIIITIILLVVLKYGVVGVLYAQIFGTIFELILLYFLTWNQFQLHISWDQIYQMLAFSVFLILPQASSFILTMSNRFFLQKYQTLEDVGLFSLGYKIAAVIPMLFTEPVKKAFGPHLFSMVDSLDNARKELQRFSRVYWGVLLIITLIISMFSKELIFIMSDKAYHSSYVIVFVMGLSYVFLGLSGVIILGIQMIKKNWILTVIWPFAAFINVLLNVLLIPSFNIMGAAFASLISYFIICLLYLYFVKRMFYVSLEYKKLIILLSLTIIFYVFSIVVNFTTIISIFYKITLLSVFLIITFNINYFENSEIALLKKYTIQKLPLHK